jgi:hypothetical protein
LGTIPEKLRRREIKNRREGESKVKEQVGSVVFRSRNKQLEKSKVGNEAVGKLLRVKLGLA